MTCTQCGAEMSAKAAFCSQCGAAVSRGAKASEGRPAADRVKPGGSKADRNAPEEELWSGGYSPKAMIGWFISATILMLLGMVVASFAGPAGWLAVGIGALVVFGYLGLMLLYKTMSIQYRLTTHRLVLRKGILNRVDDRILLVDIDDITVAQSFINRLFNLGRITLLTSDQTTLNESKGTVTMKGKERGILVLDGIENPRHVGDLIDESRRAERTRRGVYMMEA